MALKISLKPHERMIIGTAVIMNGSSKSEFMVENTVPILRDKDIMTREEADSPSKRIYLAVQLMYIDEKNLAEYHQTYWTLVRELVAAAPSTLLLIDQISAQILDGKYYQALKLARQLIEYEQEAIRNVRKPDGSI